MFIDIAFRDRAVPLIISLVYNVTRKIVHRLHGQSRNCDSSSTQTSHGTFHSAPVFRTCIFHGITPSLLKSPTRKARNEFQLPALANIRSTSPTRDATDSKSRRFPETSANPTHVPRWSWHLVISRSAISFLLCSMKIARCRTNSGGKEKRNFQEMKAVKKTRFF